MNGSARHWEWGTGATSAGPCRAAPRSVCLVDDVYTSGETVNAVHLLHDGGEPPLGKNEIAVL